MAQNEPLDLFVVCGESSGDVLAHSLLSENAQKWKIAGVTGPMLESLSVEKFASISDLSVSGTISLLTHLPRIFAMFFKIRREILTRNPRAVLLVDNAEFSLLLGKSLKKAGYPGKIIQLVAPSVWAWRSKRKETLEKYFDLLLVLYPFEQDLFDPSQLTVKYVGHPAAKNIADYVPTGSLKSLGAKTVIASFPGSRKKEISLNLPLHLKAVAPFLKADPNYTFAIAASHKKFVPLIRSYLDKHNIKAHIVAAKDRFELMSIAHVALAKFGTVNLELALMKVPTVATFPLPLLERWILGSIFRIYLPHYCLTNILTEMRTFPEYLGPFANVKNVQNELKRLLKPTRQRAAIIEECCYLRDLLKADETTNYGKSALAGAL